VNELRCAFIGCGGAGMAYLDVYRDHPGVRVTACIDIDMERASAAARSFESGNGAVKTPVLASANFADALTPDVDLLVINTPNHIHREQAVAALQLNKHVFLQKPLASTLDDAVAILAAARESKGRAGVYMSYFDQSIIHDFREMAIQGWFGDITQLHARLMHSGGMRWAKETANGKPSWRGSVRLTGGGAFIQLAVHYIRMMCWITGQRVERVMGFASNLKCPGIEGEDTAVAILEFSGGTQATLNVSWCAGGEEFSVHGTRGTMTYLDNHIATLRSSQDFAGNVVRYTAPDVQYAETAPVKLGDARQPFNQHRKFLEELRNGEQAFVSIETAVRDMVVVEAFYESVRTGKAVSIASFLSEVQAATA